MVSTVEKYAPEIEIFTLSRGIRAQISRSGAQKRRFQRSVCGESGRTDFFNRIGQKRTVDSDHDKPNQSDPGYTNSDADQWSDFFHSPGRIR
ncbi:hypothetical protein CRX69_03090 [Pseudomonas rhizophila]|uniref:Uncharacterized protein n=1 Tax=Pseudomonas rhizophila TaxID=2045200 RepID=A0ABM6U9U0_9PSED|nr:hypothetical protein CRX69_03090 [Pseudomonas rhizophila]